MEDRLWLPGFWEKEGEVIKRDTQGVFVVLQLFSIFTLAVAIPNYTGDKTVWKLINTYM